MERHGSLLLEEKLLEDAVLAAIRAARDSFQKSGFLAWRLQHALPPYNNQEGEERRKEWEDSLAIFRLGATCVNLPPPKHSKH